MNNMEKILQVKNLKKYFFISKELFKKETTFCYAVDDISFDIFKGETFGLVGESGCGKTTTGRLVIGLDEPTGGNVFFKNEDLSKHKKNKLRELKKDMQIIFQDPYSSLDPRKTVGSIIEEPLEVHKIGNSIYRKNKVLELLNIVGLQPEHIYRYPHEFSGGQRQRVGIARALVTNPEFIVCDEPVSALDVSIQSQILNLLAELQKEFGLTYLFIAHNLGVVRYISDRICVMYLGRIVELSDSNSVYDNPLHPYTKALISSIPEPDPKIERSKGDLILDGDVSSSINMPTGCRFHPRCKYAKDICISKQPEFLNYAEFIGVDHFCACHFTRDFIQFSNKKVLVGEN
jgi:oligopeptide transport system ATP-binding protein